MRMTLVSMVLTLLLCPLASDAQDGRATLDTVAKAMGATTVKSIQYTGSDPGGEPDQ